MFTKIKLKNFRSFDRIELDLTQKGNEPKHLAILYGENGAGKSNLMAAFILLADLLRTMDVRDAYEEFLAKGAFFRDEGMERAFQKQYLNNLRDMGAIIRDYRMVDCDAPICVEYEFSIGGSSGCYSVQLGEDELLHERLEYVLNRRRGLYFDCSAEDITINDAVIQDKDFLADVKATAKRYWGKHSLLAILLHELQDKSNAFGRESVTRNFMAVLRDFNRLSYNVATGDRNRSSLHAPMRILANPVKGRLGLKREDQLAWAEKVFTKFFASVDPDIRALVYEKNYQNTKIDYVLYEEKLIAGSCRHIAFERESTGNQQLLQVLCCLLTACMGRTVILDEAEANVHDLLFQNLLQAVQPRLEGQLIMTTHNTMLMEADFARESTYILHTELDDPSRRKVTCITDYRKRTYAANNIRSKYLNRDYGGVPEAQDISIQEMIEAIRAWQEQKKA